MALVNCDICNDRLLTEADPYLAVPTPQGYKVVCLSCILIHTGANRTPSEFYKDFLEELLPKEY